MDKQFSHAYHLAVRYLAPRARSIREMETYLSQKQIDPIILESVIRQLVQDKYLDDERFAAQFIESRSRFKPKSRFALGYELKAKGIGPEIYDPLLSSHDDLAQAFCAVRPKLDAWAHLDPETRKKKLMNYLRYRGFDFGVCMAVWDKLAGDPLEKKISE